MESYSLHSDFIIIRSTLGESFGFEFDLRWSVVNFYSVFISFFHRSTPKGYRSSIALTPPHMIITTAATVHHHPVPGCSATLARVPLPIGRVSIWHTHTHICRRHLWTKKWITKSCCVMHKYILSIIISGIICRCVICFFFSSFSHPTAVFVEYFGVIRKVCVEFSRRPLCSTRVCYGPFSFVRRMVDVFPCWCFVYISKFERCAVEDFLGACSGYWFRNYDRILRASQIQH